ncbi:MAG TPA: hypothetical protein VFW66_09115 [Gemmatimonadales bacterium]|nr:hypothetical protein [Gemmatimonadales bacterium]
MLVFSIPLGPADRLAQLFSYPNIPGSAATLAETIHRWFDQTLRRDGLAARDATFNLRVNDGAYTLNLIGPPSVSGDLLVYTKRLPQFLKNGWGALSTDIPAIKAANLWDPQNNGWRFMLPWGMAMVRHRALQLFHFPPMNLLDPSRDYLDDAVPVRCDELLQANGVTAREDLDLLSRVIDCVPIAAGDDQGTYISPTVTPTDYFADYQKGQIALLLNLAASNPAFTVPLVVYGGPAKTVFQELFGVTLGVNQAVMVEILPGVGTPVLGANHPYYFFAQAQGFDTVGDGKMIAADCPTAQQLMVQDLIAARWLAAMANDPSQNPQAVLSACTSYWNDPAQAGAVCAMVQHEGSLYYANGTPADFSFPVSLEQGAAFCQANGNNPCAAAPAQPAAAAVASSGGAVP